MNDGLTTTTAETLVPGDRRTVFSLIESLADHLWGGSTEVVLADAPSLFMHALEVDARGVDAWLTWELTSLGTTGWTIVRLIHDEADASPGPPPELEILLTLLVESATSTLRR
ncbi:MAG: hypothetical protein ACLGI2_10705 [Acidimicrobiia bacterium]